MFPTTADKLVLERKKQRVTKSSTGFVKALQAPYCQPTGHLKRNRVETGQWTSLHPPLPSFPGGGGGNKPHQSFWVRFLPSFFCFFASAKHREEQTLQPVRRFLARGDGKITMDPLLYVIDGWMDPSWAAQDNNK